MSLILHIQAEVGHGDVQSVVSDRLHDVLKRTGQARVDIQDALLETTKTHFQRRYPGSKHYDPNKVTGSVI